MKKRQVVLGVVVMLIMLTTRVYATIGSETKLSFDYNAPKDFLAGEEFTVKISLKNLQADEGIKSIEGYIDYDENIIEPLTVASVVTDSNNKVEINENNLLPVYDANNLPANADVGIIINEKPVSGKGKYKVVVNFSQPVKKDVDFLTIKAKIKDGVTVGTHSGTLTYKLFTIFDNNAKDKLLFNNLSYDLKVAEKDATDDKTEDKTDDKTDNKTEDKTDDKTEGKDEDKTDDKTEGKDEDKTDDKTEGKDEDKTNDKTDNKNEDKTEDKTDSKNEDKTNDKTDGKNEDKTNDKTNNKNEDKTDNKTDNKTENKIDNKTENKVEDKKSGNQTTNKTPANKAVVPNAGPDGTVAPSNLPKTGYRGLLIPIIAMIVLGLVFYKKYSKYNNYHE